MSDAFRADRLAGARLLVVEDDFDSREELAEFLEMLGAEVHTAASGNEAFERFAAVRPEMIVSDIWMPNGTGYDLITRIRSLPPDQGGLTPAIALSGGETRREALLKGFHVFLEKPFDLAKLADVIADFADVDASDDQPARSTWSVEAKGEDSIILTFAGHVGPGDIRAAIAMLDQHLAHRTCDVIVDIRKLTGFSPSAPYLAERMAWPNRERCKSVVTVGGPALARLAAQAVCALLGLPWRHSDQLPGD